MRDERRTPVQTSSIDRVASAFEELVRIQRHDRFMVMVRGELSPYQAQTQLRAPGVFVLVGWRRLILATRQTAARMFSGTFRE